MKHIKIWLTAIAFLVSTPALAADNASDPFQAVVAAYLAANPKPQLPEQAHKYRVQAEFAVQQNQFDQAADLYGQALAVAPWWPQGHFDRAIILAELKKYREAIAEMNRYLRLDPAAPDARAAQDKIYQWEVPQEFRDCPDCPAMVGLPDKGYAIGKYDVTFDEWDACVAAGGCNGYTPNDGTVTVGMFLYHFAHWGRGTRPVINVSWDDAQSYMLWLSHKTGKQYRLPTEAEWLYACYGGVQSDYCGGNDIDAVAWYNGNSGGQTQPVGQKQANGYGLYDMSGNVWQWMQDKYDNEHDWLTLRGGSWYNIPQDVRAASRRWGSTAARFDIIGFRLARTLP